MSDDSETTGNVFVFSFSAEGFEAIVNLTAIDEQNVFAKLSGGKEQSISSILSMMEIRAQVNGHRAMEVWLAKLAPDFTEDDLTEWAESDPQAVADFARLGTKIGGGRYTGTRRTIT